MTPTRASVSGEFRYRVYWEDTDAGGVVYHARYLQFLERARSDWLAGLGVSQAALRREHGVIFAVTRMQIDFRRPARLEDELDVTVAVQPPGRASLDFSQRIRRGDELIVEAEARAACLDGERFAPAPIPAGLRGKIRAAVQG